MNQSVQEIINNINLVLEPSWKFEMDDFYGDKGCCPYPQI